MAFLLEFQLLFTQNVLSEFVWVLKQRVIMFTELLALIIDNKLILELFHNSIKLFLIKLEVAVVHRESLLQVSDLLFERLDLFDVLVVDKVKVKSYG